VTSMNGKRIVLTGAGRAGQVADLLAQRFAKGGASIVLLGRNASDLDARVAELRSLGADASGFACDLTDPEATGTAARSAAERSGGRIDALVNLAGGFGMSGNVADSDVAVFHQQIAINLTTAYVATRAFLHFVRAARGSIVFFSSAAALPTGKVAGLSAYAAAKSAVITLMRAVAAEESKNGVRANAVAPNSIRTATNVASMGADAKYVEPDDLANVVGFLCSDDARAVSGQVVGL
jgi:NAD(P)-dependent dehydrogenase (short-subunit alcohol dehydrogenase family)